MSLTCKAAVLRTIGAAPPYAESLPLSIEEITLDPPGPMEVLVKVTSAGLCHSDLSVINGTRGRAAPMVMGHEGAGEIVEVGAGVDDLKPGDPAVFQFSVSCGRCARCQSGRPQLCEAAFRARAEGGLITGGRRIRDASGERIRHHSGVSCFAEYAVMHRGSIVPIAPGLPVERAAVFGCAVMTGVGAVLNTAGVRPGESVAVFGLGGVGLCGIMGAKLSGARIIIGCDPEGAKRHKALALGATHVFDPLDAATIAAIHDLTGGGVDHAFDLAGVMAAMTSAYASVGRGGQVVTAGLTPAGSEFAFDHAELVSSEKSIRGSYMGSCVPVRDIPRFLALHLDGALPVDQLIDGVIGFDEINAGFDRLASGAALRQILAPHGA